MLRLLLDILSWRTNAGPHVSVQSWRQIHPGHEQIIPNIVLPLDGGSCSQVGRDGYVRGTRHITLGDDLSRGKGASEQGHTHKSAR